MTNKDDDNRVIADMSGIQRKNLWLPRSDETPADSRPWDESGRWNREEQRSAVWGALGASLLVGAAFAVGLGLVILIMYLRFL